MGIIILGLAISTYNLNNDAQNYQKKVMTLQGKERHIARLFCNKYALGNGLLTENAQISKVSTTEGEFSRYELECDGDTVNLID